MQFITKLTKLTKLTEDDINILMQYALDNINLSELRAQHSKVSDVDLDAIKSGAAQIKHFLEGSSNASSIYYEDLCKLKNTNNPLLINACIKVCTYILEDSAHYTSFKDWFLSFAH